MNNYVDEVKKELTRHKNPDIAGPMKAYMKNKFEYLGIKSPERRELSKPFLSRNSLPPIADLWFIVQDLWSQPEREFQYFAMELFSKYHKAVEKEWIDHYEFLITNKSWWDTVDFIAATLVGLYFKKYPEQIQPITSKWMEFGNIWLQRSCLIFQLKYKNDTDNQLLSSFIIPLTGSKEFFIAKAIGWALREYSKSNPDWVLDFVNKHTLQPLSKREAIRRII